ncbi:Na-translocating system protein MpsC family protein [Niallia oryzisoli]|uniref:Na-translocating system protein MpsC family protein n=1 Tax=Niallia oryzisoli TaxID=1737571 RepID=A0ABZ2C9E2_9BACI
MTLSTGQFKQELIKDYNTINLRMFDIGVKSQKVDLLGEKVIIFANHKRISSLKYLDENNRLITRLVDVAIIDSFKMELKTIMENKYGMKVLSIMKDYDPDIETSVTIIILDQDAKNYISG